jgi:hypothetical protein
MTGSSAIREHIEVIGADGVHIGTIDRLQGARIKLKRGQWSRLVRHDGSGSSKAWGRRPKIALRSRR